MRITSIRSIQLEIALWASLCLVGSGIVIVAYTVTASRATAINAAEERALAEARTKAGIVKAEMEVALDAARTRAQELVAVKNQEFPLSISRDQVNAMMRQVLVENPQYIGVWTLWEPNAFDGQDDRYANTEAYGKSGRYFPYWNRGTGEITVEPIVNFDTGDWYQVPKRTKREYITNLYTYPVVGKEVLMISVVAPIVANGVFYGVAGEDIPATFLQKIADKLDIYEGTGKLFLIGNDEKIVASTDHPEVRGRPLSDTVNASDYDAYLMTAKTGAEYTKLIGNHLLALVPISFGNTGKRWAAMIIVPSNVITAHANSLMWKLIAISSAMILVGVGALSLVARRIALPIRHIAEVARRVAAGDLAQTVQLGARCDELGVLAQDFNHMTRELRSLYDSLKQRVAELKKAEEELTKHRDHLEELVLEQTSELTVAKERAEASNRAKSVFLATMSHELRTPLNAVLGFSQLLRNDTNITTEQVASLDIIIHSSEHLMNLINNVLDISKIESGQILLEELDTNILHLLHEMQSMMYVHAKNKDLSFSVERSADLPHHIAVDSGKLRQVLINLIWNGIKYTQSGQVTLRVKVANWESPRKAWLRFEVQDTGSGIHKEDAERIFLPFVQLGDQPSAQAGTGLGLAISKQYVELMGGQIGVDSEPGNGSVFHFEIPVAVLPTKEIPLEPRRGPITGLREGQPHYRLLIVEDQPENRLLLHKLLEPLGFELLEAVNGQEAVTLFGQWHPHLIWMDIRMPVMDGLEATRRIKATKEGGLTKVVALTAHALEEERRKILAAGCDDFIRKPYRQAEIFDALAKHLGLRFRYAEEGLPIAEGAGELAVERLATLSPALIEELRRAAELLDGQHCLEVTNRIRSIDHELGVLLGQMISDLRYKALLAALDRLSERGA